MSSDGPDFTWDEFAAGGGPGGKPPSDAERFKPCFRHADRTTGITCQRCDRPICGECMVPASVGFQCPVCVAEQAMAERPVTNRVGKKASRGSGSASGWRPGPAVSPLRLTGGPVSTTVGLMVIIAAVGLIDLVGGQIASLTLVFHGPSIAAGQIWRMVTGILVTGGLLNMLITLLFLWFVGRSVEAEIGRWRMLVVMLLAGLGGATALMLFAPTAGWSMAFPAILGLLAAVAAMKFKFGEDVKGDLILLGLMVAFSVVMGSVAGWISELGAIASGAGAGFVLATAKGPNQTRLQVLGLAGIAVACIVLAGARVAFF